MLFMTVFTYGPEKRDEILAKRMEGLHVPEGAKLIGQWSYAGGGRAFTLTESDNQLIMASWCQEWNHLGNFEIFPVVETEELMKAMTAK